MAGSKRGGNHAYPASKIQQRSTSRFEDVSVRSLKAQLSRAGVEHAGIQNHAKLTRLALLYEVEITDGNGRVL